MNEFAADRKGYWPGSRKRLGYQEGRVSWRPLSFNDRPRAGAAKPFGLAEGARWPRSVISVRPSSMATLDF
jgi:hypothetical protein